MTFAAWVLTPLVFLALTSGFGFAVERVCRTRLPDGGIVPLGFCAVVVVALFGFSVGLPGGVVTAVVCLVALAGWISARGALREHLTRRAGLLAFAGVYAIYLLPVVASGDWSWTGYNFVNDTAVQMLLAEQLADDAFRSIPFDPATSSIRSEVIRIYLLTDYPIGSHSFLALLDVLVPGGVALIYQPYLGLLGGTAAMALTALLERAGIRRLLAAVGGILAMAGNLTYQYALQGNMKEIALMTALAASALMADGVVRSRQPGAAIALGLCGAAVLAVYSAAGAPYLVLLGVGLVAILVLRRAPWRWLLRTGAIAVAVLLVAALPALAGLVTFGQVASGTFATEAAQQFDLGHLLRPLKPAQVAGVWLGEDYRVPVLETNGALTDALSALVLAAAVVGLVEALRRRALGLLLFAGAVIVTMAVLATRVSPYANGKLLAVAGAGVVLLAWYAIAGAGRHHRGLAGAAGALMCVGIAWSDALAYHGVKLAPTDRMASMQDVGKRLAGRGLVHVNEPDEFAKVFFAPSQMNSHTEAVTPRRVELREPADFKNRYFDLDDQGLEYLKGFAWIVTRRSPDASRPPADYRKAYENRHYVVWKREPSVTVMEHLPLQKAQGGLGRPTCRDVERLSRIAGPGGRLIAAGRPQPLVLNTATASRSSGWAPHPYLENMVVTNTPGSARRTVEVPRGGRFRAWVQGSFGRDVDVWVDDRRVGAVKGVNNLGQWHEAGEVRIKPGRHRLELRRAGGGLAPGDGYRGELGPLMLTPIGGERLESVAPADAPRLCRGVYDWIEAVRD